MKKRRGSYLSFPAILGLALMGLSACSTTKTTVSRPCPKILIPKDAAKLTHFKAGSGHAIIDVTDTQTVSGFAHACSYQLNDAGEGEVTVQLAPTITSVRGPANTTKRANFEYFIAIVDGKKRILEKARFPVTIPFVNNVTRVQWQRKDPVVMHIPLKAGQSGADFTVFVGLQLTRDELNFVRRTR